MNPSTSTYTGLLNWPATVKLTTAALNLMYIQNDLTNEGYVIAEEDIKKEEIAIATKTVFGLRSGKTHTSLASLRKSGTTVSANSMQMVIGCQHW